MQRRLLAGVSCNSRPEPFLRRAYIMGDEGEEPPLWDVVSV